MAQRTIQMKLDPAATFDEKRRAWNIALFDQEGNDLPGVPGPAGPQGPDGPVGPTGPRGPQGSSGPRGNDGIQGPMGPAGANGTGFNWRGNYDPAANYAVDDVAFYGGTSYIAVLPTTGVTPADSSPNWDKIVIAGPAGPPGVQGPTGAAGPAGADGAAGPPGPVGPQGSTGPQGAKGDKGDKGDPGTSAGTFRGPWVANANPPYNLGDLVTYNGRLFVAPAVIAPSVAPDTNPAANVTKTLSPLAGGAAIAFDIPAWDGNPWAISGTHGPPAQYGSPRYVDINPGGSITVANASGAGGNNWAKLFDSNGNQVGAEGTGLPFTWDNLPAGRYFVAIFDGDGHTDTIVLTNGAVKTTPAMWTPSTILSVVADEGTVLSKRSKLNFVGAGVTATDDPANDQTVVTIPGGTALDPDTMVHRGVYDGTKTYHEGDVVEFNGVEYVAPLRVGTTDPETNPSSNVTNVTFPDTGLNYATIRPYLGPWTPSAGDTLRYIDISPGGTLAIALGGSSSYGRIYKASDLSTVASSSAADIPATNVAAGRYYIGTIANGGGTITATVGGGAAITTPAPWVPLGSLVAVADEGTALPRRASINFVGAGITATDDPTNKRTVVTVPSGSGHTIEDEGTVLSSRSKLNFVGAGVTATDDAANDQTVVTIPGSSGGSGGGSGAVYRVRAQVADPYGPISTGTLTLVTFASAPLNDGLMWSAADPTKLVCKVAGQYDLSANVEWDASNTAGGRAAAILKNGTAVARDDAAGVARCNSTSTNVDLAVGDYVQLQVYQTSGGNLNITASGYPVVAPATLSATLLNVGGTVAADPSIVGVFDFSAVTGTQTLFTNRDGDLDVGYEVIYEGFFNIPTAADRFITLRPNGVSTNSLAVVNSAYSGAANGAPAQASHPNVGLLIGQTGGAASASVVGRAIMKSKADRYRTCHANASSYSDNNYNVTMDIASVWTDQAVKITSLGIDFSDGTFTGRVIVKRLAQSTDVALGMPPRVTALPSNPVDGQEIMFVADAANGIVWHMKYNAVSSSAFKWQVISAQPLLATCPDEGVGAAAEFAWTSLTTPLQIVAPLAGDYLVRFGSNGYFSNTSSANPVLSSGVSINGAAPASAWQVGPGFQVPANQQAYHGRDIERRYNGINAGSNILGQHYWSGWNGVQVQTRSLAVRPVRVG